MVFSFPRSPRLKTWLVSVSILSAQFLYGQALRVPAHIFPDDKSDVITYVKVDTTERNAFPKVLDPGVEGEWYWTTYTGDLVGYVNKREVISKNKLNEGTLIRTNPTVRSWVLTKYERGDLVRVRSRLSVGRVSLEKEIPVYFQFPEPPPLTAENPFVGKEKQTPASTNKTEPTPVFIKDLPAPEEPVVAEDPPSDMEPIEENEIQETPEPLVTAIPEVAETLAPKPVPADPLLEETPRISSQELANLAPPPADLYQEFEGFLKVVPAADELSEEFQYQLETRSGKRIVYVQTKNLRGASHQEYVDQWINIRGSLDEIGKDFTLFIDAYSIWVAPEE